MSYSPALAAHCANPDLNFESFVYSDETAAAFDFAHRIVRQEIGCSFNPICFVAASGLGKTHLLSAISNESVSNVLMIDTVDLIREYQIAVESGRLGDFRLWVLSWDLLLMDNIHYCQTDSAFQRELLIILDRATRDNCIIVATCNKKPTNVEGCDPSVVSRLLSGVTLEMKMANPEARLSILQREFSTKALSDEQLKQIADKVDTNIRELKAAARQLTVIAETRDLPLTGEDIEKVTSSFHKRDPGLQSEAASNSSSPSVLPKSRSNRNAAFLEEILSLAGSQEERSLALQIILLEKLRQLRADDEADDNQAIGEVQAALRLLREYRLGEAMQMIRSFAPVK